ncbi:TetR/AcrR family transcriptional regulator [Paenibacillus sp. PL2-23]
MKKQHIYEAAAELIASNGFAKVSVQDIADKAGVSPATIYNYFGTKEQLHADMLEFWVNEQIVAYEEILASNRPYPEKVKAIMLMESRNVKAILPEASLPSLPLLPEGSEDRLQSFFVRLADEGQAEGYMDRSLTDVLLLRYFRMYMSELRHISTSGSQAEQEAAVDQLLHLFFYGLMGQTAIKAADSDRG